MGASFRCFEEERDDKAVDTREAELEYTEVERVNIIALDNNFRDHQIDGINDRAGDADEIAEGEAVLRVERHQRNADGCNKGNEERFLFREFLKEEKLQKGSKEHRDAAEETCV